MPHYCTATILTPLIAIASYDMMTTYRYFLPDAPALQVSLPINHYSTNVFPPSSLAIRIKMDLSKMKMEIRMLLLGLISDLISRCYCLS